jgi:propionyl-CoA synthetase
MTTDIHYMDGELNVCYLALDKHIQDGYGDQVAFIYDSPVTQTIRKYTFLEKNRSSKTRWRDAILRIKRRYSIIYMPMIPQAAFVPCARIGVIHSVVLAVLHHTLAIRIDDCKPRLIITASSGIEVTN